MSNLVSIAFAVRDGYGNDTGVISAVDIGEDILRLENCAWEPKSPTSKTEIDKTFHGGGFGCWKVEGKFKISRRWFPIVGYKSYWGNLAWDCYIFEINEAIAVIKYLHSLGMFSVDEGSEEFYDAFNSNEFEFSDSMLRELREDGIQRP